MIMQNKRFYFLSMAVCMVTLSLPAQAWRGYAGGGSGVAYGSRGGSAAWNNGVGVARGPNGGVAAWNRPSYGGGYGYRAPVYYGGGYNNSGQVAGAAVAGLAVGAMMGAAASRPAPPPTIVVQQALPLGSNLTALPNGCVNVTYSYVPYYQCGPNWLRGMGTYFQVVPAPY